MGPGAHQAEGWLEGLDSDVIKKAKRNVKRASVSSETCHAHGGEPRPEGGAGGGRAVSRAGVTGGAVRTPHGPPRAMKKGVCTGVVYQVCVNQMEMRE